MRHSFIAAVMGALLAAPLISGCSDNNTSYESSSELTSATTAETTAPDEEETTEKASEAESEEISANMADVVSNGNDILYIMDNGDYVYVTEKNDQDGPHEVYVRDNRKGSTEELDLPEHSVVYHCDGEKLYYYSPDEGLCVYDEGKSSLLSKDTKSADYVPRRESFYFFDDGILFCCPDGEETEIKIMDYSGKLSQESFHIDHKNARIVGYADIGGKTCLICSYDVGVKEHIIAFDGASSTSYKEIAVGDRPVITGGKLYYIDFNKLYSIPVDGGEPQQVSETPCMKYCFLGDKLIFTDTKSVFSLDSSGEKEIMDCGDLTECDFIKEIGTADGRLFVRGGSGAFYSCLAETDEKGRIIEEIYSGEKR